MNEIVVDKLRLIEIMRQNRENHAKIVQEAQAGFRARVISRLDEMLAMAQQGKKIDINVGLQMPVDMTGEYDTVIGMLELDINETVALDQYQYKNWVQDDWDWSRQALASNALYSRRAANQL
jgi:bifunctional ADP-heptose synthase (sugar kinase/adenylyltransferase)